MEAGNLMDEHHLAHIAEEKQTYANDRNDNEDSDCETSWIGNTICCSVVGIDDSSRAFFAAVMVIVLWCIYILDISMNQNLSQDLGIKPKEFPLGWIAVLWSSFLQNTLSELLANSLPFYLYSAMILRCSRILFVVLIIFQSLATGSVLWYLGPEGANLVGSSCMLVSFFSFLTSYALFTGEIIELLMTQVIMVFYGSILRVIFPSMELILWQANLTAILVGVIISLLAFKCRRRPSPLEKSLLEDIAHSFTQE